jgi:intraflagellar transport protein 172
VAYAWAVGLGGDQGAALLQQLGLAEAAVEYAVEVGAFAHAFQLAEGAAKGKLPEVHLKYAMYLEDSGRFEEAEQEFLNAGEDGCAQVSYMAPMCVLGYKPDKYGASNHLTSMGSLL